MLLFLALWLAGTSQAGELRCIAQLEDSSSYQVAAEITEGKMDGDALFFYLTNDGMEIGSMLKTLEAEISPGKSLSFIASNGKTKIKSSAVFDPASGSYRGKFEISFAYNSNPPLQPPMSCEITP